MLTVHLLWILNNLHQYFFNWNMDSPPKKWHLTWQFLMQVTRMEDLGWKVDLAAHVSEIFWIFTTFLNSLYCHLHLRKTMGGEALGRISLVDGHFFPIRSPQYILYPCSLQNPAPGITWLEALWELWAWEKNPMPDKVDVDSRILSPQYNGKCGSFNALCSFFFPKMEVLISVLSQGFLNGIWQLNSKWGWTCFSNNMCKILGVKCKRQSLDLRFYGNWTWGRLS